jgi:hypothetical protein
MASTMSPGRGASFPPDFGPTVTTRSSSTQSQASGRDPRAMPEAWPTFPCPSPRAATRRRSVPRKARSSASVAAERRARRSSASQSTSVTSEVGIEVLEDVPGEDHRRQARRAVVPVEDLDAQRRVRRGGRRARLVRVDLERDPAGQAAPDLRVVRPEGPPGHGGDRRGDRLREPPRRVDRGGRAPRPSPRAPRTGAARAPGSRPAARCEAGPSDPRSRRRSAPSAPWPR